MWELQDYQPDQPLNHSSKTRRSLLCSSTTRRLLTVWHDGLFSVLQQYGVPRKLINIIRDLYSKAKSCIRVNNNLTDWFETTIGVWEGCLLSPDLFNLFLENILAEAFEDCKKLGINVDGYKLKDLRFADDIALIADSENDLQTLMVRVHDVSKKYGMEISIPKTKAMIFSHEDQLQVNIKLDDTSLDQLIDSSTWEWHLHRQMTPPARLKVDCCWHQQPWGN